MHSKIGMILHNRENLLKNITDYRVVTKIGARFYVVDIIVGDKWVDNIAADKKKLNFKHYLVVKVNKILPTYMCQMESLYSVYLVSNWEILIMLMYNDII